MLIFFFQFHIFNVNGYTFFDDFNYYNISKLIENGWIIYGYQNYVELTNDSVILKGDKSRVASLRYFFNITSGFKEWVSTSIGRWNSGPYGSLSIVVMSPIDTYVFSVDGYSHAYVFTVSGKKILRESGYKPDHNWHNLSIKFNNNTLYVFFDKEEVFVYNDTNISQIKGIGVNPS